MKKVAVIVVIALAVIGLGIYLAMQDSKPKQKNDFGVPSNAEMRANLKKAGLDALKSEGLEFHIHQHLDITIEGKSIPVPANLGVGIGFISPMHTHDGSGIIHVESPVRKDFKLGQFFDQWGLRFDDSCIANYCADSGRKLIVAVNGEAIKNARDYVLKSHGQIEVWFGNIGENPTFKKTYQFPEGT